MMLAHPWIQVRRLSLTAMIILESGVLPGNPQDLSPFPFPVAAIEDSLVSHFNRIEDYTAQVRISVDMPRLRIPAKQVHLYYKRPGRVKVELEGFAVVPRMGLATSPREMMNDLFRPRVTGEETHGDRRTWILEGGIHPDSMKFVLFDHGPGEAMKLKMRLWVEDEGWYVSRVETLLDTTRVMVVESSYEEYERNIWLPVKTELRFFISGRFLDRLGDREAMGGPFGETHGRLRQEGQMFEGRVRLEYSDYRINQGLEDRIFEERE